ncbi:MAG: 3'-5' exonuclease [Muribaculaceae bacterium]|nr:3'-5' exonuclease [Muribaculaceae bacterium]
MELNLRKPLVFFDLETTGLNITQDRIVEIAYVKVFPNGKDERKVIRVNPGIPIPEQASNVHHIYDEDVKNEPTFKQIAADIVKVFEGSDIAGYNSNKFDLPMLSEELARAGSDFDLRRARFIDVQTVFFKMEPRTLEAAYRFYCNKNLNDAHSALADTSATYEVLKAQLDKYPQLQNDAEWLSQFTSQTRNIDLQGRIVRDDQNMPVFNFGKYKGQSVKQVFEKDCGYYGWIMKGDFAEDTKRVVTLIKMDKLK